MSEIKNGCAIRRRVLRGVLAPTVALSGTAACGSDGPNVERCPGEPIASARPLAAYSSERAGVQLKLPVNDGRVKGDPGELSDNVREKVKAAVVKIKAPGPNGNATGFIIDGGRKIVTAAHVVGGAPLKDITITTSRGKEFTPASGCYMFQDGPEFEKPNPKSGSIDVAVLAVRESMGSKGLKLKQRPPRRSEWIHYLNYQRGALPGAPAEYAGLVVRGSKGESVAAGSLTVITGLQSWRGIAPSNYTTEPGSSGGPLVDGKGEVVGAHVESIDLQNNNRLTTQDLKGPPFNVTFTRAGMDGLLLDRSTEMNVRLLQKAVQAA